MEIRRMHVKVVLAAAVAVTMMGATVRAANVAIEQTGQKFSEKSASVSPGDTLTFTNKDDVTHNINVINADDDATDLGLQKPGENIVYKFDKSGRFKVRCSIHPSMKMDVKVN